jgi:hypothetical protein
MPYFFFDIDDGENQMSDDEGIELESLQMASYEAAICLNEFATEQWPKGDRSFISMKIRDVRGSILVVASLSLVIERLV